MDDGNELLEWFLDEVGDSAPPEFLELVQRPDVSITSVTWDTRSDPVHSWSSVQPIGYEREHTWEVELEHGGVTSTHTIDGGISYLALTEEDEEQPPAVHIGVEELDDDHHCPICSARFDEDIWEYAFGFGDRSGASSYYDCPTDECEGTAVVLV